MKNYIPLLIDSFGTGSVYLRELARSNPEQVKKIKLDRLELKDGTVIFLLNRNNKSMLHGLKITQCFLTPTYDPEALRDVRSRMIEGVDDELKIQLL